MNIDQLIKDKTQILRNNQGKIVNGIAVEDLEAVINEIKAQGIDEATERMSDISCGDGDWWYDNFFTEYADDLRQQSTLL